ncbi:hypothetical protein A2U01_0077925, partial [Trifolium medium]|nr:hypothetical protein [Trifolium medium]
MVTTRTLQRRFIQAAAKLADYFAAVLAA